MPDNLMEAALLSCLDGSFAIVRASDGLDDPGLPGLLSRTRSPTGLRPLAAYLTHRDEVEEGEKEQSFVDQMNLKTYERVGKKEPPRVQLCSPCLFINAHVVAKKIGVDIFDLKAPDGKPRLINGGDWPSTAPTFKKIIDEYIAGIVCLLIVITFGLFLCSIAPHSSLGADQPRKSRGNVQSRWL
jgi:hypothetical protein